MSAPASLSAHDEAAIAWMVEFASGASGPQQQQAFAQWLAADVRHRHAWQRLGGAVDQTMGRSPRGHGRVFDDALQRSAALSVRRRRMLGGALGVVGTVLAGSWAGRGSGLLPDIAADLHTSTGERRRFALGGGSSLLLDARSSVDLAVPAAQRGVVLREGQLIATVQDGAVPFQIASAAGRVCSAGGRLMVRRTATRSLALALEQGLEIVGDAGRWQLRPGEAAWFDAQGLQRVDAARPLAATAWSRGMLEALDEPLGSVVEALRAYRGGLLLISAEAARLRVTGSYPLDDSDAALQALAETLPVAVRRHGGGLWVHIGLSA